MYFFCTYSFRHKLFLFYIWHKGFKVLWYSSRLNEAFQECAEHIGARSWKNDHIRSASSELIIGVWWNGIIGVSKTFGGSSILSTPVADRLYVAGFFNKKEPYCRLLSIILWSCHALRSLKSLKFIILSVFVLSFDLLLPDTSEKVMNEYMILWASVFGRSIIPWSENKLLKNDFSFFMMNSFLFVNLCKLSNYMFDYMI